MDNKTLAIVNGVEIKAEEMGKVMMAMPDQAKQQLANPQARRGLLDEMVNRELLYTDALDRKLDESEEFLTLLEEAKRNLLQQFAVDQAVKGAKVSDADAMEYYEKNKDMFKTEEEVRARHILVKEEEEARKIADEIKTGKEFADAAKEYSTCPSSNNGGDLGFFGAGKMVPEFDQAAFALEVGELSHIVKTQFGYHIIKVENKKEATVKPFEEVKHQIVNYLIRQQRTLKYTEVTSKLRENAKIEVNEEAFEA